MPNTPNNGDGRNRGGRPKGSKDTLPSGSVKLIQTARQAERLGIKADEAWGTILQVMRGEITGRYLRDRLSAAVFVLEQEIGKARQRIQVDDRRQDGIYRAEFADGSTVHSPEDTPELPN